MFEKSNSSGFSEKIVWFRMRFGWQDLFQWVSFGRAIAHIGEGRNGMAETRLAWNRLVYRSRPRRNQFVDLFDVSFIFATLDDDQDIPTFCDDLFVPNRCSNNISRVAKKSREYSRRICCSVLIIIQSNHTFFLANNKQPFDRRNACVF